MTLRHVMEAAGRGERWFALRSRRYPGREACVIDRSRAPGLVLVHVERLGARTIHPNRLSPLGPPSPGDSSSSGSPT